MRIRTLVWVAVVWLQCCTGDQAPSIVGTWSGSMLLDAGKGADSRVTVQVTLRQDGDDINGEWRTLDGTGEAAGHVSGTVTADENGRQRLNIRFTYAGRHPFRSVPAAICNGNARAEGQLTYNTTVDTSGQPSPERPG